MPLKVWSKFSVKKGGNVINLRIVDMPDNLYEKVVNLYMNYYVKEDPIFKASGLLKSAAALEELREMMQKFTKGDGLYSVICCIDNGDDQVNDPIAASMMALTSKGDPEPKFELKTEEIKKMFEIYYGMEAQFSEQKAVNLDRYYSDRGTFLNSEYKDLGILQELLKVRRLICKEQGIPMHGTWMTSHDLQSAAEADGWETAYEIKFEDLGKQYGVAFDKEPVSAKFMIVKI
nr:uncharacterized protein LOC110375471 [Helicoverpa armigera]